MSGAGGAGVVNDMARAARRQAARLEARRLVRAATRRAVRDAGTESGAAEPSVDLRPFPCARLCQGCGQLNWPTTHGDPMRAVPADPNLRCAHCQGSAFVDLTNGEFADALLREQATTAIARKGQLAGLIVFSVIATGAICGGLAIAWWTGFVPTLLILAGMFPAFVAARALRRYRAGRTVLPKRWSMVPRPASSRRVTEGNVRVAGPSLRTPLSGHPCAAYEIAIAAPGAANDSSADWLLIEQRSAEFTVDTHRISDAHLVLPRTRLDVSKLDDAARRFLVERGIDPTVESVQIYESWISEGAAVKLRRSNDGVHVIEARTASQVPLALAPARAS